MPNDPKGADDTRRTRTGSLGAGAEAAAALHAAQPDAPGAAPSDAQHGTPGAGADLAADAVTGRGSDGATERSGSEPLARDREHKGSYGGEGGAPRTSSDTREPINPS